MYYYAEKAVQAYHSVTRRNREPYVAHCLRVAARLEIYGVLKETQVLGLVHDIFEVNPTYTVEQVKSQFHLSDASLVSLDLLTRLSGETSEEHFQRVLTSNNLPALLVKLADCLDNSDFKPEDYFFTVDVLGLDPNKEITKYIDRSKLVLKAIENLGYYLD